MPVVPLLLGRTAAISGLMNGKKEIKTMNRLFISSATILMMLGFVSSGHAQWVDPNATNNLLRFEFNTATNALGKINDDSGHGNHATVSGTIGSLTWMPMTNGVAPNYTWSLLGSKIMNLPLNFITTTSGSYSAWFKYPARNPGDQGGVIMLFWIGQSGNDNINLYVQDSNTANNRYIFFQGASGGSSIWQMQTPNYSVSPDMWHFISATWAPNDIRLYLDNVLMGQSAATPVLVNQTAAQVSSSPPASLERVWFYNKALSSNEFAQLYWNTATNIGLSEWSYSNPALWSNEVVDLTFSGTAQDWSPRTNHGAAYTIDYSDGAALFNGTNTYVSIADNDSLSFGNSVTDTAFSISFWMNPSAPFGGIPVGKFNAATGCEWRVGLTTNGVLSLGLWDNATNDQYRLQRDCSTVLQAGVWTHVAMTYDGSASTNGINIYINGQTNNGVASKGASYVAMHNTTVPVELGRVFSTAYTYYKGSLDLVLIYKKALTPLEVGDLYSSTRYGRKVIFSETGSIFEF